MKKQVHPALAYALVEIDEAFEKKAWHGPNLKGSIRGLDAKTVAWRPAEGRHNIAEIVVHAAYWKYAVRRRLLGEPRGSFPLAGSNWFARQGDTWAADVRLLVEQHRLLRDAIESLPAARLPAEPTGVWRLIRGAAAHDVYHAGQIRLLKKLCLGNERET
jgi:hypothetical protein